jgi:hypothetical protein
MFVVCSEGYSACARKSLICHEKSDSTETLHTTFHHAMHAVALAAPLAKAEFYFDPLQVPLLGGRWCDEQDRHGTWTCRHSMDQRSKRLACT